MLDWARGLAREAVRLVGDLLDSARAELHAWVHGGDIAFMVVLAALALVMLVLILVPGRRY